MPITRNGMMLASLKRGTSQIGFVFQGTVQIWANEVVVVLGDSGTSTYLASLFDTDVWLSDTPKRVVIPEGVERGSTWNWVLAPIASTAAQADSWGGNLVLENRGTISGASGAANSGTGGTGIIMTKNGRDGQSMIINNYGTIRAGGGGGGLGGNGGPGYYYGTVQEGPYYDVNNWLWETTTSDSTGQEVHQRVVWNNYQYTFYPALGARSHVSGSYTYYRGSYVTTYQDGSNLVGKYQAYRTYQQIYYTSGGPGGAGGRGQGYGVAALAGSGGSAGGTNAGAGGTGGAGASWGATGGTGNSGSSGNNGAGAAGAVGGLGGYYLNGSDKAVLNNFGTVLGRLN